MKLNEDFFEITSCTVSEQHAEFTICLNATHPVYGAHFPGNPVTPGVCIIQMVQELSEKWLGIPLVLHAAKRIKFLNVINPVFTPFVHFILESTAGGQRMQTITAVAAGENGEIFSRLSLTFETR